MKRPKRASARAPSSAPRSAPPAVRETPLQWLRRRKDQSGRPLLTQTQFQAGEKLAQDYGHAQLQPRGSRLRAEAGADLGFGLRVQREI